MPVDLGQQYVTVQISPPTKVSYLRSFHMIQILFIATFTDFMCIRQHLPMFWNISTPENFVCGIVRCKSILGKMLHWVSLYYLLFFSWSSAIMFPYFIFTRRKFIFDGPCHNGCIWQFFRETKLICYFDVWNLRFDNCRL